MIELNEIDRYILATWDWWTKRHKKPPTVAELAALTSKSTSRVSVHLAKLAIAGELVKDARGRYARRTNLTGAAR